MGGWVDGWVGGWVYVCTCVCVCVCVCVCLCVCVWLCVRVFVYANVLYLTGISNDIILILPVYLITLKYILVTMVHVAQSCLEKSRG